MFSEKVYGVLPQLEWQNHCQSEVITKASKQGDRNAWNSKDSRYQKYVKKL